MTLFTTQRTAVFLGNGASQQFPFFFRVLQKEDLRVEVVDAEGNATEVLQPLFNVTLFEDSGVINYPIVPFENPLPVGFKLIVRRTVEPTQETAITNQQKFFSDVVEDTFDRQTMLIQQLYDEVNRSLKLAPSVGNGGFPEIPQKTNQLLVLDESGKPSTVSFADFTATLETPLPNFYSSREAFQLSDVEETEQFWIIRDGNLLLFYVRDQDCTAIESNNGVRGAPAGSSAFYEHWGAVGDGSTNDFAAVNAAIAWTGPRKQKLYGRPGAEYRITGELTSDSNVFLQGNFYHDSPGDFFLLCTAAGERVNLAADYVPGQLFVDVATLSEAPKAGQIVKIISSARDPSHRWIVHTDDRQHRVSEWAVVGEGSTTTRIYLQTPLEFLEGIPDGVDTTDRVPSYTTAANTVVIVPDPLEMELDVRVRCPDGESWNRTGGIIVEGYRAPKINFHTQTGYSHGLTLACVDARVTGSASNLGDNYGIQDRGTRTIVDGFRAWGVRHGYTTNSLRARMTDGNGFLYSTGRTTDATVRDSYRGGPAGEAGFDTHHCAERVTFINCTAEDTTGNAFQSRGKDVRWIDCTAVRCASLMSCFTDFMGGNLMLGGALDDLSTAEVSGIKAIDCGEGFTGANRRLTISGHNEISLTGSKLLNGSGVTEFRGSGNVRLAGGDDPVLSQGLYSSSVVPDADDSALILRGHWSIDATEIDAPGVTITGAAQVVDDGRWRFDMPEEVRLKDQVRTGQLILPGDVIEKRVPTDYPDLAHALHDIYYRLGARYQDVHIIIEDGHEIAEPYQCSGMDFRNFKVTSEAAEVLMASGTGANRAFEFLDGGTAPQWGFILDCDGEAQIGHYLGNGSRGVVLPGCGVRRGTVTGFRVIDGSSLAAAPSGPDGLVSTDNGQAGVWVTRDSRAALYHSDLRRNGISADGIGYAALFISRGAVVNADRANLSESGYGVRIARSRLAGRLMVAEDLVKGGITAFENADVSMSLTSFNRSGDGTTPIIAVGVPGSTNQGNSWVNIERCTFDDCDGPIVAGEHGTVLMARASGQNVKNRVISGSRMRVYAPSIDFSADASNTQTELVLASRSCEVDLANSDFDGAGEVRNVCRILHNGQVEASSVEADNFTESFARVEGEGRLYCDSTTFDGGPVFSENRSAAVAVTNADGVSTRFVDGTQICTHWIKAEYQDADRLSVVWLFPQSFIDKGARTVTPAMGWRGPDNEMEGLTREQIANCKIILNSGSGNSESIEVRGLSFSPGDFVWVNMQAIGRWK